jgi:tetratricopeptide (TPR) repeat protein
MRRLLVLFLFISLLALPSLMMLAQNQTPPAPTLDPQELFNLATQVAGQAAQVNAARDDAKRYAEDAANQVSQHMETANNLLGLFQNVTAIAGVIIPLLAVLAGVGALSRLNSAQKELEEAKDRFEKDMGQKQEELNDVSRRLEASAKEQRENAARANLAMSLLALGERQYKAQDFAGAIDTYRRALELDPDSLITHYRLGYVYVQSGSLQEAERHLTRALDIEKDFAPALAALGYVYRRTGEKMTAGIERDTLLNKGESLLLKALTISPKLIDEDGEAYWGSLGGLYRRRGQIDAAIEAYRRAAEATPSSSYAFSNLALLYVQTGNKEKMLPTYERVEQLAYGETQASVDNYWAYADLLTARLALGKAQAADETLYSVFRTAPIDSPYALESLLDTLRRLAQALGAGEAADHVYKAIERIETEVERRAREKTTSIDGQD